MKFSEFAKAFVSATGLPLAYYEFKGDAPSLPFAVYMAVDDDGTVFADNTNFYKATVVDLELYFDKKDLALEESVESFFDENEIPFNWDESFIDTEQMFIRVYEFTIGE